jgi:hypothetical protein
MNTGNYFPPVFRLARQETERGRCMSLVLLRFCFWANSYFEAMTFYYSFLGFGTYTTNEEWDYKPYPQDWLEEQRGYINAL